MPDPTIDERDIEARIGECDRLMEHEDGVDAPGFAITMMLNYSHIRNAHREQQKVNARLRRFVHGGGRKTMVCVPARTNRRRVAICGEQRWVNLNY